MITKELLTEVLGKQVVKFKVKPRTVAVKYMKYGKSISGNDYQTIERLFINKYELAYKCKELALKYDIELLSTLGYCYIEYKNYEDNNIYFEDYAKSFKADTEPEAIFEACQWILENKELKDD